MAGQGGHEKRHHVAGEDLRERIHERSEEPTQVHGHPMQRGTVFKFAGLLVFVGIMVLVMVLGWPLVVDTFMGPEDLTAIERARVFADRMQASGPAGIPILLALQLVQVIVAFIPGEVVQLVAGLMYGPWLGAAIIIVGCFASSAVVYKLVHTLGAPFVQSMVSTEHLEGFRHFEQSGKLDIMVFVLFLIPGLPKDVFTYIVPLTDMPMKRFLVLANVARIPGIMASTFVASGLANERYASSIVVVVLVCVAAVAGFLLRARIMGAVGGRKSELPESGELSQAGEPGKEAEGV